MPEGATAQARGPVRAAGGPAQAAGGSARAARGPRRAARGPTRAAVPRELPVVPRELPVVQREPLNRVGQIAFINEPHLARQFDLSILARARRAWRRGGVAEEEAAVAGEGSPGPAQVEGEAGEGAAKLRLIRLPRSASAGSGTRWRLSGGKAIAANALREAPTASGSAT